MNAEEPTPGVGPCIDEIGITDRSISETLYRMLEPTEFNIVDLLIPHDRFEVFVRVFIGLECLNTIEVHVRGCGDNAEEIKKLAEKPEFTRILLERNCVEIVAPWDPPIRLLRALELAGVRIPVEPIAYRVVRQFVLDSRY